MSTSDHPPTTPDRPERRVGKPDRRESTFDRRDMDQRGVETEPRRKNGGRRSGDPVDPQ